MSAVEAAVGVELVTCLLSDGCPRCGSDLPPRARRWCSVTCRIWFYDNHRWTQARDAALRSVARKCIGCGATATEVDHIAPRNGSPIHALSCHHHQDNLRALCHDCHVNRRIVFREDHP